MCKYVKKETINDQLYDYDFCYKKYLNSRGRDMDNLITLKDVVKEKPSTIFKFKSILQSVNMYNDYVKNLDIKLKKLTDINIGNNKLSFNFDDRKKKKENTQFWICGDVDSGKTYNIDLLEKNGYRGYFGSKNNDWNGYDDNLYDFIYFEEYNGENTIQFMNQLLEGTRMNLNVKCHEQYIKNKHLPIFINSNKLPHEAYHNVDPNRLNLLLQRIYVIYLDKKHNAHLIWSPKDNRKYNYNLQCLDTNLMTSFINGVDNMIVYNSISSYTNISQYRLNNEIYLNNLDVITTEEFIEDIPDEIPVQESIQVLNRVEINDEDRPCCAKCGEPNLIFGNSLCLNCKYGGGVMRSW